MKKIILLFIIVLLSGCEENINTSNNEEVTPLTSLLDINQNTGEKDDEKDN